MKKHVRYYLVTTEKTASYRKLESDLPFSPEEGEKLIIENNKDVKSVQKIAKSKAEMFLGLGQSK